MEFTFEGIGKSVKLLVAFDQVIELSIDVTQHEPQLACDLQEFLSTLDRFSFGHIEKMEAANLKRLAGKWIGKSRGEFRSL